MPKYRWGILDGKKSKKTFFTKNETQIIKNSFIVKIPRNTGGGKLEQASIHSSGSNTNNLKTGTKNIGHLL